MTDQFEHICRFIARMQGEENERQTLSAKCSGCIRTTDCDVFEDDKIVIVAARTSLNLQVEIKEGVTDSGLSNPVLYVDEFGRRYRWHGEAGYVFDHLRKLLYSLTDSVINV